MNKPFLVTLTGPTCAGKSKLESLLRERGFQSVISSTTRPARSGESSGIHYHFLSVKEFEEGEKHNAFVEAIHLNGHRYGTSADALARAASTGDPVVMVVEPEGLKRLRAYAKAHGWSVFSVFVDGDPATIAERFLDRMLRDFRSDNPPLGLAQVYARRLSAMMTTERDWREEAQCSVHLYELLLSEFNPINQQMVVDEILKEAMQQQAIAA